MRIKTLSFLGAIALFAFVSSCGKEECHECHYEDANNNEVELGEFCGDELENLEANGTTVNGVKYDVHCHEH
ncbi:MAG: hypothetical protein KDC92_15420 [Bacteroidetes bacterium]|nr:hypothetical protein [Bacteroidota bacterium]